MKNTLSSTTWKETADKIRECHLSLINQNEGIEKWNDAFDSLITSILDERKEHPTFATELYYLTIDTGFSYDLRDVLEEYFDHLEENGAWEDVVDSCTIVLNTFAWNNFKPSEYKYRIGNALLKEEKLQEAEEFGIKWLKDDPTDLYAAASNAFLLVELGRVKEARQLAERFLDPSLVCEKDTETVFMAAMELYNKTNDEYAKRRVEEKIAEYNKMIEED